MDIKLGAIVLDSADSEGLSDFYAKLLGWNKRRYDEEWIIVSSDGGEGLPLVFQQVDNHEKPVWPGESGRQQQMLHLDFFMWTMWRREFAARWTAARSVPPCSWKRTGG